MTPGSCHAIGCRARILETEVFCATHGVMLEDDTRRLLAKTFRVGRRQSQRFYLALAWAVKECLFYQTHGHRMPRASNFMWDEDADGMARR